MLGSALPLMILGIAIHIAFRQAYSVHRDAGGDLIVMAVTIVGWVMFLGGVTLIVSPFWLPIVLIIFSMAVSKYRDGQRRSLLWSLSLAAEKGMPLADSARAFAAWRHDEMARRARKLADLLDAGIPLASALRESGNPLSRQATLMVKLGGYDTRQAASPFKDSETLAVSKEAQSLALLEAVRGDDESELAWRPILERIYYLMVLVVFCFLVVSFIMIKIMPTYKMIFQDFGTELPLATRQLISISNWLSAYWFFMFPLFLYFVCVLLVSAFFYARGRFWIPWPFSWVMGQSEHPLVLEGLAVCLEQGWQMPDALRRMSDSFPTSREVQGLRLAAVETAEGKDWCDTLRDQELVSSSEAAVLRSAAKAQNLTWAFRELAELSSARLAHRANMILNIVSPLCLLVMGLVVGFVAISCMIPLVSLIQNLT